MKHKKEFNKGLMEDPYKENCPFTNINLCDKSMLVIYVVGVFTIHEKMYFI